MRHCSSLPFSLRARVGSIAAATLLSTSGAFAQSSFWLDPPAGPGGGDVQQLVRQPDGDLFAAMSQGALYRSHDDGWSWEPLPFRTTSWAMRLGALPNGDLYALDAGLDRSRDDGATWTHLAGSPPDARVILAVPGGRLLVGTAAGIYRSDDDGASWQPSGLAGSGVGVLLIGPDAALYAGAAADLARSADNGEHWSVLTSVPMTITALAPRPGGGWWIGTAHQFYPIINDGLFAWDGINAPIWTGLWEGVSCILTHPDGRMFLSTPGIGMCDYGAGEVYCSGDGGANWRRTGLDRNTYALVVGRRDELLAATGANCDHSFNIFGAGILALESSDNTWRPRSRGLAETTSSLLASAPGLLFAQAGNYLASSTDHAVSWRNSESGIPLSLIYPAVAAHPAGDVFMTSQLWVAGAKAGTVARPAEYGAVARTRDGGATWAFMPALDWSPWITVTAAGSVLLTPFYTANVARSTDRGDTWVMTASPVAFRVARAGSIARVFAASETATFVSLDDGVHWEQIAAVGGDVMGVARDEKRVFLASSGTVRRLDEIAPGNWTVTDLPALGGVIDLAVDRRGDAFAATGGVWRLDAGNAPEWQAIPLPVGRTARALVFDDADYLYVGGKGVLRSLLPLRDPTDTPLAVRLIAAWRPGRSPFRDDTEFRLGLARRAAVSLVLYDVRGRLVSELWNGTQLDAGFHDASWLPDERLPSGAYFYRLQVGSDVRSGRVVRIR